MRLPRIQHGRRSQFRSRKVEMVLTKRLMMISLKSPRAAMRKPRADTENHSIT